MSRSLVNQAEIPWPLPASFSWLFNMSAMLERRVFIQVSYHRETYPSLYAYAASPEEIRHCAQDDNLGWMSIPYAYSSRSFPCPVHWARRFFTWYTGF